ncbi:NUDIX hydrolase [Pedomonas mirosovicensis]|uniref:NUDIX hydrolase n=1 Tax=Pedomonas mirosovicensis TaxID=2908641 RepID=UPI0021687227|nr:NUDIX hydrolase [Pedomonas mirosovicensis]MCH8686061.1 NUDIX hydrolase [Pedomonas mirosovicensis]
MSEDHSFSRRIPPGDTLLRRVCDTCGFVDYENPKIVVGAVVRQGEQVLLCRRAIEPRHGFWTIPAGFMELNETAEEGARREAREEACADIRITGLLAVYSIPRISQVQLIYVAELTGGFAPGPESLEVRLFDWDDIPWDELAFPSVHWALRHRREVWEKTACAPFVNPPGMLGDAFPGC